MSYGPGYRTMREAADRRLWWRTLARDLACVALFTVVFAAALTWVLGPMPPTVTP